MSWISINPKAVNAWVSDWAYDVLDAADFCGNVRIDEKDLANAYNRYGDPEGNPEIVSIYTSATGVIKEEDNA